MSDLGPDDCLVVDGVYHHHITPADEDRTAWARIAASIHNNGTENRSEYMASVDMYEYDMMLSAVSYDMADGIEQVGSVGGPMLSAFHFDADGARQLAEQLLAVADGLDALAAGAAL
jgi:hypothetical protein